MDVKENKDGSFLLSMTKEENDILIQYAVTDIIKKAIKQWETTEKS